MIRGSSTTKDIYTIFTFVSLPINKSSIEHVAVLSMLPVCLNYFVGDQSNIMENMEMESENKHYQYIEKE